MNILFITPLIYSDNPTRPYSIRYTPGVASLSAYLKKYGHSVGLVQYFYPPTKRELLLEISNKSPDIIGFSFTTHMFHYVREWSRWIKERFDIPIICGGIHPTIDPENTIMEEGIDIICRGEGEEALLELCTRYERGEDITNILNLWVKRDGKIYKNPLRPLIEDLDSLPFPDREISKTIVEYEWGYKVIKVMVSRGCPYNCSFCCVPKVREVYQDKFKKFVRYRSVENSIQYLKKLITNYPTVEYIVFNDDVLNSNRLWFAEFTFRYRNEIVLPYMCLTHVNLINKEVAGLFSYSGCKRIYFGLESGNDYIRKKIYNKPVEREQILRAFKLCQDEGIQTYALNMIGAPFEDMSSILDTVKLNAEAKVSNGIGSGHWPFISYPYPGTGLYKLCKDHHFLTHKEFDDILKDTVISQPSITSKQIVFAKYSFMYFVKLYVLINKFPVRIKKFCSKILDKLFLYKRLPYSFIILIYRRFDNILFRLYIIEKWIRIKFPRFRILIDIIKKR